MRTIIALLVALVWTLAVANAHAVVVFPKGSDEPVMGFLLREDERSVTVRQVLPDGSLRDTTFLRSEADIHFTVQKERLEKLASDNARAYRNYAEELAEKRRDPEARETAIRLFLIAAFLDPQNFGRSSLLGMIDLSRSADEEAKFRAMAFLLDPEHDARVLRRPEAVKSEPGAATDEVRSGLLTALRLLRQGKGLGARQTVQRDDVNGLLVQYQDVISVKEFYAACAGGELSPSLLRRIVLLELALSPKSGGAIDLDRKAAESKSSWSDSIRRHGSRPLPALSLETLTEFNPRECHFRDGKWLEPAGL